MKHVNFVITSPTRYAIIRIDDCKISENVDTKCEHNHRIMCTQSLDVHHLKTRVPTTIFYVLTYIHNYIVNSGPRPLFLSFRGSLRTFQEIIKILEDVGVFSFHLQSQRPFLLCMNEISPYDFNIFLILQYFFSSKLFLALYATHTATFNLCMVWCL